MYLYSYFFDIAIFIFDFVVFLEFYQSRRMSIVGLYVESWDRAVEIHLFMSHPLSLASVGVNPEGTQQQQLC